MFKMFVGTSDVLCHLVIFFASGSISYQTDDYEVAVYPDHRGVEPGTDIEFLCNTTINISSFHWEINDKVVNLSLVTQYDDHSMTIFLDNVGVNHNIHHNTDVVCVNTEDEGQKAGAVVYVGYPPLAPNPECLMQNVDVLHCRWNNTDPRTSNHIEWQHKNYYNVKYIMNNYHQVGGECILSSEVAEPYYSSCTAKRKDDVLRYWSNVIITFNAQMNKLGENSTSISFNPIENVMLSKPRLKISQIESSDEGETLEIEAFFTRDPNHFMYCQNSIDFQVEYTFIPKSFDMNRIKLEIEEEFWKDWDGNVTDKEDPNRQFFGDSILISEHAKRLNMHSLPANTQFLLRSKWKLAGAVCSGVWSLYSYATAETHMLPPPAFSQTAILYLKNASGCSFSLCNLFPINSNADSETQAVLLWKHTSQSEAIHRNNVYHYEIILSDGVAVTNVSKYINYMPLSLNSTDSKLDVKIYARNSKGFAVSPDVIPGANTEETCQCAIVSMELTDVSASLLRFEVTWYSSGNATICNHNIQNNIKVNMFYWKQQTVAEGGGNVTDSMNQKFHDGMEVNTLHVNIHNNSSFKSLEYTKEDTVMNFQTKDIRNSTAEFHPHLESYSAYRIAIAFSMFDGKTSLQGPAHLGGNFIFYHDSEKPSGTPNNLQCTGVKETSIGLSWSPVRPQMRNGPIIGYIVYYTTNKSCFAGHGGISKTSPYEFCNDVQVYSETYQVSGMSSNKSYTDGWYVETPDDINMSITLTDLEPGTSYYIGISAYNAAGTCDCFRQIIQETKETRLWRAIIWLAICIVILGFTIFGIFYLRRVTRQCRREVPGPECRIPMESTKDIDTKYMDSSLYSDETVDIVNSCDHLKQTILDESAKVSLLKSANNNDIDLMLMHCDDRSSLSSIALYLKPAFIPEQICNENLCDHNCSEPLGSDVPCCSSSSNGGRSDHSSSFYDSNESSLELDNEIYLSPEIALIKCRKVC